MRTRTLAGLISLVLIPSLRAEEPPKPPDLAARLAQVRSEYDAQSAAMRAAVEKATSDREGLELYQKLAPDDAAYSRRMVDIALTAPRDPAARDAFLWVIDKPGQSGTGPYGDEFARAAALLVRHHGDDPEAVRIGLSLDNVPNPHRDALLTGFVASAKGREARGLARQALAQYLKLKALTTAGARKVKGRQTFTYESAGEDGKPRKKAYVQSDEEYAYQMGQALADPEAIRAESERLFEEVVAEYGDVPTATRRQLALEAALKAPTPVWEGKTLTPEEKREIEAFLAARPATLADAAKARLDEMRNLAVGKPAPEIAGVDFEGKPMKLSDYRGKVVAMVFWGTWCGPCMAQVPHERELSERLKGKPFALLGVNCDEDKAAAVKVMAQEKMTWPQWHDGAPGVGPIVNLYHVRGYPTVFVIDAEGIIRATNTYGTHLDQLVDELLKGAKPPTP